MKEYKKPLIEVLKYAKEDVLTGSQGGEQPAQTDPPVNTCVGIFTYAGPGGDNSR